MIPDLLHYFFTGQAVCEATDASTTQMIDPRGGPCGAWARALLAELGLGDSMLGDICPAGTVIGPLRADIAEQCGAAGLKVIAPASHDTASAIAAVPAEPAANWCYLSSGTWSLMGVELEAPLINEQAMAANFTNERGLAGTVRFLKNIPGMWLVQQVRQDLAARGAQHDYAALAQQAAAAPPFRTLVDPNHEPFMLPGGMIDKLGALAAATGQPVPTEPGAMVRCCLESLALEYRRTLARLEGLLQSPDGGPRPAGRIDVIHIVGGGGRNDLLNQMTADATGRTVVVGPYEATAAGNALVQAMGDGQLSRGADIRRIIERSFQPRTYRPAASGDWEAAFDRYLKILAPR
jgi:rhamnulokinase